MQTIRCFIAVDISPEIKDRISSLISHVASQVPRGSVRWVERVNLHLTLKFLGEIQSVRANGIQKALDLVLGAIPAFDLSIAGAGLFPSARKPRIIWLGILPAHDVSLLAAKVDNAMQSLGFESEDRPFSPHLTIGRVSRDVSESALPAIAEVVLKNQPGEIGMIRIQAVTLFRSDLRPQGPIYTPLAHVQLADGKSPNPC